MLAAFYAPSSILHVGKEVFILWLTFQQSIVINYLILPLRCYLTPLRLCLGRKIVLVAIQDAGDTYISPAIDALKRLGATDPILTEHRSSFAFVGYAQANKPSWIAQEQQNRYEGPSEIFLRIPLTQSHQTRKDKSFIAKFPVFIRAKPI